MAGVGGDAFGRFSRAGAWCQSHGRRERELGIGGGGTPTSRLSRRPLSRQEEKKVPPPIPKKPSRGRGVPVKERSLDSVDRQRQEARKRLLAAKRAASFRHSSATESADSIEIYIPEAQTRL